LGAMKPASVCLIDNEQLHMAQAMAKESSGFRKILKAALLGSASILNNFEATSIVAVTISYEGSCDEVALQKMLIRKLSKKHGAMLSGSTIGKAGYNLTFAIAYLRDFALTYSFLAESFETFVPWSKLSNLVEKTKQRVVNEFGLRCLPGRPMISARVTQLYDNGVCVYFYLCLNLEKVDDPSVVFGEIEHCAREEILDQGGSLSHHHGIGKLRAPFMEKVNSLHFQNTLVDLKRAIDPKNIFGARNGSFSACRNNDEI